MDETIDWDLLVAKTDGFSGADISNVDFSKLYFFLFFIYLGLQRISFDAYEKNVIEKRRFQEY